MNRAPYLSQLIVSTVGLGALACASLGCADDETLPFPFEMCGTIEAGDDTGHADPFGAKAAGQARAGRIADASSIMPPAHGRQGYEDGDFVLANDKIAVIIEDKGISDGYGRFGGEIIGIDQVGPDGKPLGKSFFGETIQGLSIQTPNPTSVTVINDGSNGEAAVVRVVGPLETIPFSEGSLEVLFSAKFGGTVVAYDYSLAPGDEKITITTHVANSTDAALDFTAPPSEVLGFFQGSRSDVVTPETGFDLQSGDVSFAGFTGNELNFAYRATEGMLRYDLDISGFYLFYGKGFMAEPCSVTTSARFEVIVGGPYYDGLRAAVRRASGPDDWRVITGVVSDSSGTPMGDTWVHVSETNGTYLARTKTDAAGAYSVHAPPEAAVELVAARRGFVHTAQQVAASASAADLEFEPNAEIQIIAVDSVNNGGIPVRIQVIPTTPIAPLPAKFGQVTEVSGRLHQDFAMDGTATLPVPPGEYRVLVTRGYEWELHDETITVAAGTPAVVNAVLEHSVDSTNIHCADFHIHTYQSADSSDPFDRKIESAVADGLDIICSSEHEWVVDFGPIVKDMGLDQWAMGMGSSELTSFRFGHFGVVPLEEQPDKLNNGAIDWIGLTVPQTFDAVDDVAIKPALIVNHPRSGMGGYFAFAGLKTDATASNTEEWSENFDAIEVFNDAAFDDTSNTVRDWFTLLNAGKKVSAVGNSDSHKIRTSPVGYPRTCYNFGTEDISTITSLDVRDVILAGKGTISGGIMLTVAGPDQESPGELVETNGGSVNFTVTAQSPSWLAATEVETYVNGELVGTEAVMPAGAGTANRYVNTIAVTLPSGVTSGWVVFHVRSASDLAPLHPNKTAFAVSNAIFLQ